MTATVTRQIQPLPWLGTIAACLALTIPFATNARPGDSYFCVDVSGDLEVPSEFRLIWSNDGTIILQFIENELNSGPQTTDVIAYQTGSAFVAYDAENYEGLSTFSLIDNPDGTATAVRTYVDVSFSFAEKSTCEIE